MLPDTERPPLTLDILRETFDPSDRTRFKKLCRHFHKLGEGRDRIVFRGPDQTVIKLDRPSPEWYDDGTVFGTNQDEIDNYAALLQCRDEIRAFIPPMALHQIPLSKASGATLDCLVMPYVDVLADLNL